MDIADTIEDTIIKKYYKNFFKNKIFENLIKKNKNKLNKLQISNSFDMSFVNKISRVFGTKYRKNIRD